MHPRPFAYRANALLLSYVTNEMDPAGIEPTASSLQGKCSTIEHYRPLQRPEGDLNSHVLADSCSPVLAIGFKSWLWILNPIADRRSMPVSSIQANERRMAELNCLTVGCNQVSYLLIHSSNAGSRNWTCNMTLSNWISTDWFEYRLLDELSF